MTYPFRFIFAHPRYLSPSNRGPTRCLNGLGSVPIGSGSFCRLSTRNVGRSEMSAGPRATPIEVMERNGRWKLPSSGRLFPGDGQPGLRPESCWNDCLTRRRAIRPRVPSHVAYEVGAARQQTVRSPRTMDPHSQEWHRNREATVRKNSGRMLPQFHKPIAQPSLSHISIH